MATAKTPATVSSANRNGVPARTVKNASANLSDSAVIANLFPGSGGKKFLGYGDKENLGGKIVPHSGIDVNVPNASPVYATESGTPYKPSSSPFDVIVQAGKHFDDYVHVRPVAGLFNGNSVKAGQLIGYVDALYGKTNRVDTHTFDGSPTFFQSDAGHIHYEVSDTLKDTYNLAYEGSENPITQLRSALATNSGAPSVSNPNNNGGVAHTSSPGDLIGGIANGIKGFVTTNPSAKDAASYTKDWPVIGGIMGANNAADSAEKGIGSAVSSGANVAGQLSSILSHAPSKAQLVAIVVGIVVLIGAFMLLSKGR